MVHRPLPTTIVQPRVPRTLASGSNLTYSLGNFCKSLGYTTPLVQASQRHFYRNKRFSCDRLHSCGELLQTDYWLLVCDPESTLPLQWFSTTVALEDSRQTPPCYFVIRAASLPHSEVQIEVASSMPTMRSDMVVQWGFHGIRTWWCSGVIWSNVAMVKKRNVSFFGHVTLYPKILCVKIWPSLGTSSMGEWERTIWY